MNRPPLIPLRPFKKPDESIVGYCLRIAKLNHFSSADEFIKSYYPCSINLAHSKILQLSITKFMSYITGRKVAISDDDFIGQYSDPDEHYAEDKLSISDKPSMCAECIEQHGYVKSEWQFVLNSYCNEHQRPHINVCPHCDRELKWNVALLNLKCQRCGEALSAPITEEPLYIYHQKNMGSNERKGYQKHLLDTAKRLVRPLDFMDYKLSTHPIMIKDWNSLFELAALHIEQKIDVPSAYLLRDHNVALNKYTEFTQSPVVLNLSAKYQKILKAEKARDLVDNKALEKWFGLEECHTELCVRLNLIKPILKKRHGTPIYDFQDVKKMFAGLKLLKDEGNEISEVANEAPLFWSHPRDLIRGILTRKVAVRFKHPTRPSFQEAWVARDEAQRYFNSQKTLLGDSVISEDIAFEVFAGPQSIWDKMLQSDLETYPTNSKKKMIATQSLQRALSQLGQSERDTIPK